MQALDRHPWLGHKGSKQQPVLNLRGMSTSSHEDHAHPRNLSLPLTLPKACSLHIVLGGAMGKQHDHGCRNSTGGLSSSFPMPEEHVAGPFPALDQIYFWEKIFFPTMDGQLMLR